jgi:thiol:disulfide interchange protein
MNERFESLLDRRFAERDEQVENLNPWEKLVWERERKIKKAPDDHLPFLAYTPSRLKMLRERNYTVLIDFTADWCLNCKTNEEVALNQASTRKLVDKNNVVVLVADLTDPEASGWPLLLEDLKRKAIPFYAIYPGSGKEPLLLSDLITKSTLQAALEEAGPSKVTNPTVTAMKDK